MVWVGLRQKQALVWRFGILLQFGAWISFVRVLTGIDPLRALSEHISLGFLLLGSSGRFRLFWSLFGTSNQLLASLSLLAISVWLYRGGGKHRGRVPWFTLVPMALVLAVTVTSLVLQGRSVLSAAVGSTAWINGAVSVVLLGLAATLVAYGVQVVRGRGPEPA